jgi:hypothetical protein
MNLLQCSDGETLDLDTTEGNYKYVAKFLKEKGASSAVFASLSKLVSIDHSRIYMCDEGDIPAYDALKLMTEDWLDRGNYCAATVSDMRDALKRCAMREVEE